MLHPWRFHFAVKIKGEGKGHSITGQQGPRGGVEV
jgi:hypothetical protein